MKNARRIRLGLGLTLEEVAHRTSIKFSHVGAFERGEVNLSLGRMQELTALYGCTLDELVAEIPEVEAVPEPAVREGGE